MRDVMSSVWHYRALPAIGFLVLAVTFNLVLSPFFLTAFNLSTIATASVEIALLALPATLLITAGEIDLSSASVLALSAAVLGLTATAGLPLWLAIAAALVTGALCGLLNGLLVTRLGLSSIVVTIATLALFRGVTEVLLGDRTLTELPSTLRGWDLHYIGSTLVTWVQVGIIVVAIAFAVVLTLTRTGRSIRFIGGAPGVALYSGLAVRRTRLLLFVLSGLMSALAGIILVSRLQAVRNDIGIGLELIAITCVLLGGTNIRGGWGTVVGTLAAIGVVASVRSGLRLANIPDQVGLAVIGGLLILTIVGTAVATTTASRLAKKRLLRQALTTTPSNTDLSRATAA
jgi:rhamnose transport system permease protein